MSDNEFRKEFSPGALPSQNVNVFIDGVSYKNDVIDGGVVGQDASRGNPFPQNAVQEFQVLTQNFKAEYEKAASAIITAITKSGGTAQFGSGDPDLSASNFQFGVYVQDDWAIADRLTLNLGLRWDYESDMLNNGYVTPDPVRTATASFVDNPRYFTDGDDRPPFYGAVQPRAGVSFDLTGHGTTLAFGGYGRYYDRVLYNSTLDERFRQQYAVRTFQFSSGGGIRDGVQTIVWDAYTLGKAEQTGGDLFSLDFPTVADYPQYPTGTDERHRH